MHTVIHMDCVAGMALLPDNTVDSIVTDPPYELGFMGKSWDASGIAYSVAMWREALRVLKPGGHLLAFSGSRTYHRMTCAIEDAGFEIRDQIMWVYGSGFPKSLDVSKAIDKAAGAVRERVLVPSKPGNSARRGEGEQGVTFGDSHGGFTDISEPVTPEARQWQGWGTALKPAHEPICVARKPLIGTVAANVLAHGTGALNVDGCRVGESGGTAKACPVPSSKTVSAFGNGLNGGGVVALDAGRWPANFIHDGLPEEWARFFYCSKASVKDRDEGMEGFDKFAKGALNMRNDAHAAANGNLPAARANTHPTVKPTDLMRYLCRLVTPPGGTVMDPFTGSGSTGKAAKMEGFNFIGFEMQAEYVAIAEARIAAAPAPLLTEL